MKAPQPKTLDEAIRLASFIQSTRRGLWTHEFAFDLWDAGTFQLMLDNDWEHVWSEEQCRQIMAAWVAYRISR